MRPRSVIALDCDDVLFPWTGQLDRFLLDGQHLTGAQLQDAYSRGGYWTAELLGCTADQADQIEVDFLTGPGAALPALPGAHAALTALSGTFDLHVVTARRRDLHAHSTNAWLDRFLPGLITQVHFTHSSTTVTPKADVCSALGAVALVDDLPAHLLALAGSSVEPILFGQQPWSHDTFGLVRYRTWKQAHAKLATLA